MKIMKSLLALLLCVLLTLSAGCQNEKENSTQKNKKKKPTTSSQTDKAAENGIEIVHSTPESFFEEIAPESVIKKSLYSVMPGCYISMSKLKRAHTQH